jgi:hypothetical protein
MAKFSEDCVMDKFRDEWNDKMRTGTAICASPYEMQMDFNPTFLRGGAFNVYNSLAQELPKWEFRVRKVDEWIEVTPEFEYYQLTIAQKEKLEQSIKTGLASAAEAVTNFELIMHDARRYREMLDYFLAAEKEGDQHVLRSLFVDRVDAFTGEGYSLITMAKRWPTIITDFIRMKEEWTDPKKFKTDTEQRNKIRKELDVSMAEATVLKTKNELFREWKKLFTSVVKERYARLQNLANARKESIYRYREWLKPYLEKFHSMRESTESKYQAFRALRDTLHTPGFGQAGAYTGVRLWTWKYLIPTEFRKPEMPTKESNYGFAINPYDDLVREWKEKIEKHYDIEPFTDDDIRELLKRAAKEPGGEMFRHCIYYALFDIDVLLQLVKTPPPKGMEIDDIVFYVRGWIVSQNVLLLHLIELAARERKLEKYINTLIGARELEDEIREKMEKEFMEEEKVRLAKIRAFMERTKPLLEKAGNGADRFVHVFVRRGPYETVLKERITKVYTRVIGPYYVQIINWLKYKSGVPEE